MNIYCHIFKILDDTNKASYYPVIRSTTEYNDIGRLDENNFKNCLYGWIGVKNFNILWI